MCTSLSWPATIAQKCPVFLTYSFTLCRSPGSRCCPSTTPSIKTTRNGAKGHQTKGSNHSLSLFSSQERNGRDRIMSNSITHEQPQLSALVWEKVGEHHDERALETLLFSSSSRLHPTTSYLINMMNAQTNTAAAPVAPGITRATKPQVILLYTRKQAPLAFSRRCSRGVLLVVCLWGGSARCFSIFGHGWVRRCFFGNKIQKNQLRRGLKKQMANYQQQQKK